MPQKLILILLLSLLASYARAQTGKIPEGFKPVFNGKNLKGWHISRSTHQGTTPDIYVENGELVLKQHPYGQGGILLTDKKYGDFELYLEARLDSFCNSGIFLRSSESGSAYQIELQRPGNTGDLLGEQLRVNKGAKATRIEQVWKDGEWNSFRVRVTGEVPHMTLWINGEQMWDVTLERNDLIADVTEGMIALQLHWSAVFTPEAQAFSMAGSWRPGAAHRFRNIAIKEIK